MPMNFVWMFFLINCTTHEHKHCRIGLVTDTKLVSLNNDKVLSFMLCSACLMRGMSLIDIGVIWQTVIYDCASGGARPKLSSVGWCLVLNQSLLNGGSLWNLSPFLVSAGL